MAEPIDEIVKSVHVLLIKPQDVLLVRLPKEAFDHSERYIIAEELKHVLGRKRVVVLPPNAKVELLREDEAADDG